MAKSIVYYLQRMAQSGKTIVCTIHQPSSEIFNTFDKLGKNFFTDYINCINNPTFFIKDLSSSSIKSGLFRTKRESLRIFLPKVRDYY